VTESAPAWTRLAPPPSPGNPGPHPAPRRPTLRLPAGATDAHCHVFGPASVYPFAPDRPFTPVQAPREDVAARQRFLGFERAVIVQSMVHGADHRALLGALAADPANRRGVALLRTTMRRTAIARLDAAGICGARLHFASHLGANPEREDLRFVLGTVAEFGWHLEIHVEGDGIVDHSALIGGMTVPVVIDHMARVDLREGLGGPAVGALFSLLDGGNVWVKVSGADRVSLTGPPYADAAALGAEIVARFPERVLWGSDYPHVNINGDAPDDGLLVDLIEQMAPTEALRERLLVTNPAGFFGFEE
jgi:2-pyrone-4,6-dicarboxylate lactonase